ncbi:MAG: glycosyl hydrolase family 28-related protein [Fimbriimonas sp.]
MLTAISLLVTAITPTQTPTTAPVLGVIDVAAYGAKGDGQTDNTAAFQSALDAAQKIHGTVYAGSGNYRFLGRLNVPDGVTLKGTWESVPSHNGIRNPGLPKPTDGGTTFLVENGEGKEENAFLTLNTNSTLKGVVFYYPKQTRDDIPKPYPYAIAMRGKNPAVLDVELLNPYNGIDASENERHLIRNISGQPLRRGIYVDAIYDIGRIENVHFNPWWSMEPKLFKWQQVNGEAFIFGRSDWEYVLNTFAFGYGVGYRFIETKNGGTNGNYLGIGADDCHTAVLVEQAAPFGILITNGEFTSFNGPDPTMVVVGPKHTGSLRFVNSAFWGPCNQVAKIEGSGTVGFSDCTFVQWDGKNLGRSAIQVKGGNLLVRGCEFKEDKPHFELGAGVKKAIITDSLFPKEARIKAADKSVVKTD